MPSTPRLRSLAPATVLGFNADRETCAICGVSLGENHRRHRLYCSNRCRRTANRLAAKADQEALLEQLRALGGGGDQWVQ